MAAPAPTASFLHPAALMAIRNLDLRARAIVEGFWHGIHRSPYHGFSVEFTEYRPYTPGDDPRYLDWKLAARTDRYYIKKFEDETNLRCHLLVDQSRSMMFGSKEWTKLDYARTLAATLAYFLSQQGDAAGLLTFDEQIREYLPARNRPGHMHRLMLALEKPSAGANTDLATPLNRIAELTQKRGMIVLISDLLAPADTLEKPLSLLTTSGHEVIVFQVLDPAELTFDFGNPSRFLDLETGRDLFLDPMVARADYLRKLNAHLVAVRDLCQRLGTAFVQLDTARPLELALFDFLKGRAARGKFVRRKEAA
jgi:uncharacterized protein (DUF58 family)